LGKEWGKRRFPFSQVPNPLLLNFPWICQFKRGSPIGRGENSKIGVVPFSIPWLESGEGVPNPKKGNSRGYMGVSGEKTPWTISHLLI
jgi:hypothetical protein